ncbi:lipoate--protein ligase family protein [bacterium]|nr:lipoate--protein ligase family protein [candidate division CSSED10-310 bacterium]
MPSESWDLLIQNRLPGSMNMALDELLLNRDSTRPMLRFYQWDRPTLTLGMAQRVDQHVCRKTVQDRGIPVIRRLTGGKAVLHDQEITYSISGPITCRPFCNNLLDAYQDIAEAFCDGFHRLDIPAHMAPRDTRSSPGAITSCFANPSAFEILVDGKKILGSAQKRTRFHVLQHGSLLLQYTPADWMAVMRRPEGIDSDRVIDLESLLGSPVSIPRVINALIDGFKAHFDIDLAPFTLSSQQLDSAGTIARTRYPDLAVRLDSEGE